jgi:hypothetical protein
VTTGAVLASRGCPSSCLQTTFHCEHGCKREWVSGGRAGDPAAAYGPLVCNFAEDAGAADANGDAGCSEAGPADACCCQLDVLTQPLCADGQWSCPPGFNRYGGAECTSCPGPCCLSIDAGTELDASDAAAG